MDLSWNNVPTTILQRIFSQLSIKTRGRCSQVCRHWHYVFWTREPWSRFVFHDHLLVRRRFTQHSGWQYALDHMRIRIVIPLLIEKWRELIFEPVENIFNLYEFIIKLSQFSEHQEKFHHVNPLSYVRKFVFSWKLHVQTNSRRGDTEEREIGTGGEILRSLTQLLHNLSGLKRLEINDLQLDYSDAERFLQEVLETYQETLIYLSLMNITKHFYNQFLHVGLFVNLRYLKISLDLLNASTIELLADLKYLKQIVIAQDEKCDETVGYYSYSSQWRSFKARNNNKTQITLYMKGKCKKQMILQPNAPVTTIVWDRSCGQLDEELAEMIISYYATSLKKFIQIGLERFKRKNDVKNRIDKPLINLFIRCHNLQYLSIRERMSNGTALILALLASNRQAIIHIRENALLKRLSWTRNEIEMLPLPISMKWIQKVSHNYQHTFSEISNITNSSRSLLKDKLYIDYV
ncbi:unnamed protein product [Auanema sp. JU1783]|nr:unnamed protein product [Auanema sp. JU1783]